MSRFNRNLLIVVVVIGLILFLLFRFMENYTSTMHHMYSPDEYEENEPDGDSDTSIYVPSDHRY